MQEKIAKLKSTKILFVEDEDDLRTIISETLNKLQVDFETASNGQEAMDKLNQKEFDLIVTDINMPVMNGLELIENVKNSLNLDVPITIMSAHTEPEYINKAQDLGVQNYLLKPFDFIKFINLVYEMK